MNNKFYVFIEGVFVIIFMVILGVGCFTWFAMVSLLEDIALTVLLAIMLLALPIGLLVWSIIVLLPKLEFSEEGVTKTIFGHKLKSYSWNEIEFIQYKGTFKQWLFLSKKDLSKKSLSRCRIEKDAVFFFINRNKMIILEKYISENLKNKLEI